MKKALGIVLAVMLFMLSPAAALAEDRRVLPSGVKYSDIEARVDSYVEAHKDTTAAVSVAVFTGNEVVMEKAYGYSDIENRIVNDKDTVFEWGSCTKMLVWTSVMQLVEKGKIDLNQDIRTYLPKGFFKKLRYDTPITMMNLMNHNAGWQETVTDLFIEDEKDVKELGDALRLIEPEQVNEPGRIVAYSNWGSALAGYIVECVSGQSFTQYIHQHIFEPLGMEHTALSATLSDNEWVKEKRMQEKCYTDKNEPLGTYWFHLSLYPAGMTTGTIDDFVKFGQALMVPLGEMSPLFEKRETLDLMLSPSMYYADGKTPRNYHGLWADKMGVPVLMHNGATLGSSSWFTFDPVSRTGMIILTNQKHESIYNCGLLPLVFGKYKTGAAVQGQDISGMYASSRSCFVGFSKPYSLITTQRFVSKGQGIYSTIPGNFNVTTIGTNSYLQDLGGVKQFVLFSMVDGSGHRIIQGIAEDYIEISGYGVIAKMVLLGLFALSALYGFFALIVSLINRIRHKKSMGVLGTYRAIVNASIIAGLMIFAYVAVKLFSVTPLYKDIRWALILTVLLGAVPVAYISVLVLKLKKSHFSKKEKVKLIFTAIFGLIMTVNIIFWQSYKFW